MGWGQKRCSRAQHLKSTNVLVVDDSHYKVADFGLARVRRLTSVSSAMSTGAPEWYEYMSTCHVSVVHAA